MNNNKVFWPRGMGSRELFQNLIHQGFLKVRVDGQIISLTNGMKLDRYKTHDIDLLIDRFMIVFSKV